MNIRRSTVRPLPQAHAGVAAGLRRFAAAAAAALALFAGGVLAQTTEDLPGRVGRVADVAGELFVAPQDRPESWAPAGLNFPIASGDNLWLGGDGRAEVDFGGGQFRFSGGTSLHVSQLDDSHFSLFVAQGRVSLRVRVIVPGDVTTIDTPNAQIAITRPGLYRFEVTDDRQRTVVIVREGEANVQTQATVQQVLPGQVAYVDGADPQFANVQNGIGLDGFDAWVASRDRLYRTRGNSYVSPQMVGAADLDRYGTWQETSQYGAVWYPSDVAADWAPYRNGYWVNVGAWGPTWVDFAPWGYAPFHYGRWAFINGRWGWCPGAFTPRPLWAPALVAWTGGAGWSVSVSAGAPVYGWIPLAWGEPFRPWWGHCSTGCWERFNRPVAVNVTVVRPWSPPPSHWRNANAPGGITAVPFRSFETRQPVAQNLVRVPRDVVATAPMLAAPPVVRGDVARAAMSRPLAAPPPASTLQPALARPMHAPYAGGGVTPPGAAAAPEITRSRAGLPTPSSPGTPGAGNAARMAPGGAPAMATPPSQRPGAVDSRPVATPSATPSGTPREGRSGMPAAPQGAPSMRAQSQTPAAATPSASPSMRPGTPAPMTSPGAASLPPSRTPQGAPSPGHSMPPAARMQPQVAPSQATPMPSAPRREPASVSMPAPQPSMRAPPAASAQSPAVHAPPPPTPGTHAPAPPARSSAVPAPRAQPAAPPADAARQGQGAEVGSATRGDRDRAREGSR